MEHSVRKKLRVMTYNIRYSRGLDDVHNLDRILEEIRKSEADVIGLQEVDRFHPRSGMTDQVNELAEALGMACGFSVSHQNGETQFGNALLSKYPILFHETHLMPEAKANRSVLSARIDFHGQKLNVFVTHLGVKDEKKLPQMPILFDVIEKAKYPSILMGDFNMRIDNPLFDPLKEQQWRHVKPMPPENKVWQHFTTEDYLIDHFFLKGQLDSQGAWKNDTAASDHLPVIADIDVF